MLCARILKPRKSKFPMYASEGHRKQKYLSCISSPLRPTKICKMPACKMHYKKCTNFKNLSKSRGIKIILAGLMYDFEIL